MSRHPDNVDRYRGVMAASYALGRQTKKHLNFRYRVRAQFAVDRFRDAQPHANDVNVLELGAADGLTLLHMRDHLGGCGEYVGVEYAEYLIAAAPAMPDERTRLIQGDVMQLPDELEAGKYDLVTALALLEHLPDTEACVREAFRMLKPGGVFVATCPNPFWNDLARKFKLVEDDFHELAVNRDLLLNLAVEAGFEQVAYRPFMWVVVGALPYLGLSVNPQSALLLDRFIQRIPGSGLWFVNQALLAQKSS